MDRQGRTRLPGGDVMLMCYKFAPVSGVQCQSLAQYRDWFPDPSEFFTVLASLEFDLYKSWPSLSHDDLISDLRYMTQMATVWMVKYITCATKGYKAKSNGK